MNAKCGGKTFFRAEGKKRACIDLSPTKDDFHVRGKDKELKRSRGENRKEIVLFWRKGGDLHLD